MTQPSTSMVCTSPVRRSRLYRSNRVLSVEPGAGFRREVRLDHVATYAAGSAPASGDVPTVVPAGAPGVAGPAGVFWGVGATAGATATLFRRYPLLLVPAVTPLLATSPTTLPYPPRFAPAATETGSPSSSVALKCDISPAASVPAPIVVARVNVAGGWCKTAIRRRAGSANPRLRCLASRLYRRLVYR